MKTQIKKMKQELKVLANQIKELKSQRKDKTKNNGCGYVAGLHEHKFIFRHKHVAYCIARGRTLSQVDSGKGLNMKYVNWILTSMKEDSKEKLYVVVNEKLSTAQQAVQAGHAVASFLKRFPLTQWENGHLIYLKDKPDYNGNMVSYGILRWGLNQYADFKEPDVGDKITAYACFGPDVERYMKGKVLL